MFNLIIGTGALTMPKAFATAGWLVGLLLLAVLAFMSFMTTTFVIEAMAVANARLRGKKCEKKSESDNSNVDEVEPMLSNTGNEAWTHEPYLECNDQHLLVSVRGSRGSDLYDITDRVEMGQMASMFFNKVGVHMFYICIVVYLYGDLAIYAAAVPRSLAFVACGKLLCNNISTTHQDSDPCWDRVTRGQAYRIFLGVFVFLLGPFAFFNVQKTKYLQILTSALRWIAIICSRRHNFGQRHAE
uniref:transmembrane protein 104 isoform X2 n=1 Tax=Myxine glutinosa TaxID=7769 RepID=UPI00358F6CC6